MLRRRRGKLADLVYTAITQGACFAEILARAGGQGDAAPKPSDAQTGNSRWTERDFSMAARLLFRAGGFTNAGSTGLAAELAWDAGAVTQVLGTEGGRRCLLVMS